MQTTMYQDNSARRKWDEFRRFYVKDTSTLFTAFETGEVIMNRCHRVDPYMRRNYPSMGVTIFHATEARQVFHQLEITMQDPETGYEVTPADLGRAQTRTFLYDREAERVVSIEIMGSMPGIPVDLASRASVYWAGSNTDPVAAPLKYTRLIAQTPETKALVAKCRAWAVMKGLSAGDAIPPDAPEPSEADYIFAPGYVRDPVPRNWVRNITPQHLAGVCAPKEVHYDQPRATRTSPIVVRPFEEIGYYGRLWLACVYPVEKKLPQHREVSHLIVKKG